MRLNDKVAIVTGAARGLGRGLALGLAREGARVVAVDLDLSGAEETARRIEALGGQALALRTNVARIPEIDGMAECVLGAFGRIDILVNNAGLIEKVAFLDATEEEYDRVLGVNLKGTYFCAQRAARVMAKQRAGKIVNIASTNAFTSTRMSTYEISKAAVKMLTISLALELAPYNINVNAIAPGMITTERTREVFGTEERWLQRARDRVPLGRPGDPEDYVGAAVFLCSDESSYVTGHTLVVDGGWLTL